MIEILGYVASLTVVVSLAMSSVLRLRMIGLVGSTLFAVYALAVGAIPVAIANLVIIGLHGYRLWQWWTDEEYFSLLEVKPDSVYLNEYLVFHQDEIRRFQPEFSLPIPEDRLAVFVLRDMVPAGVVIGRRVGDTLEIELDYVAPRFRDMEPARFLYRPPHQILDLYGIVRAVAVATTEAHRRYLRKVGFTPETGDRWELDLTG
ncbi:MAG: hypothetical protein ACR2JP_08375 [Acidimicrobiia bacterium]